MTWLERLKNQEGPEGVPTKPTKPGFVGFVGPSLGHIQKFEAQAAGPYRLAPAEADRCHAAPWNDSACARSAARAGRFVWLGLNPGDADDLAERLHLRDLEADDRRLCLECAHLSGQAGAWRCSAWRRAGVGGKAVAGDLVGMPQRCPAFRSSAGA